MSYTSIVTHNRIAQFTARFEMQADGSVIYYHPDRATGGLQCTLAECEQLIQEFAETQTRSLKQMMYWAIASGVVLGLLEASGVFVTARWIQYLIILAPFPFTLHTWHQAGQKPLRLLGTRLSCSPPRSAENAFWQRTAALPASLIVTMLLPSAGLMYYTIEGGWEHLNLGYLIIISSTLFMTGIWLYARYGRRK